MRGPIDISCLPMRQAIWVRPVIDQKTRLRGLAAGSRAGRVAKRAKADPDLPLDAALYVIGRCKTPEGRLKRQAWQVQHDDLR